MPVLIPPVLEATPKVSGAKEVSETHEIKILSDHSGQGGLAGEWRQKNGVTVMTAALKLEGEAEVSESHEINVLSGCSDRGG